MIQYIFNFQLDVVEKSVFISTVFPKIAPPLRPTLPVCQGIQLGFQGPNWIGVNLTTFDDLDGIGAASACEMDHPHLTLCRGRPMSRTSRRGVLGILQYFFLLTVLDKLEYLLFFLYSYDNLGKIKGKYSL